MDKPTSAKTRTGVGIVVTRSADEIVSITLVFVKGGPQYSLTQPAFDFVAAGDEEWLKYKGDLPTDAGVHNIVATTCHGFLLEKWAKSQHRLLGFILSIQKVDDRYRYLVPIENTCAIHDTSKHGETPHSLRHWVRGGQLGFSAESNPGLVEQWNVILLALQEAAEVPFPDKKDKARAIPGSGNFPGMGLESCTKFKHTDLHYAQIPWHPEQFCMQLHAEMHFPFLVMQTPGYADVAQEVAERLGGKKFDVIMWFRNVPESNRGITPEELDGCRLGAERAIKKSKVRLLCLGDSGSPIPSLGPNCFAMMREHMVCMPKAGSAGKERARSQLEQLQFMTAVVLISEVQLIVGERTGSVDKLALAGGKACCQFVGANVHASNERLPGVSDSGCGMSRVVSPFEGAKSGRARDLVCQFVAEASEFGIEEQIRLLLALDAWRAGVKN